LPATAALARQPARTRAPRTTGTGPPTTGGARSRAAPEPMATTGPAHPARALGLRRGEAAQAAPADGSETVRVRAVRTTLLRSRTSTLAWEALPVRMTVPALSVV